MKSTKLTIILLALTVSLPVVPAVSAAEEHEHEAGKVKIPATLAGVWTEVKEHEEELGKAIADKKLDGVHEIAFEVRDLVNALPDKSKLDADKTAKLKANAKFVDALATRLDESGDAKDQAATEANFKKLQGILKTIESLYPTEHLKADMKDMPGMKGM